MSGLFFFVEYKHLPSRCFHACNITLFITKKFLCICITFSCLLSVDRHLNWFCFLATQNSASVNMNNYGMLPRRLSSGSILKIWRPCSSIFTVTAPVYTPINSVWWFFFPKISPVSFLSFPCLALAIFNEIKLNLKAAFNLNFSAD